MWRIIKHTKILGNYKHIKDAQEVLSQYRKEGQDGFIFRIGEVK